MVNMTGGEKTTAEKYFCLSAIVLILSSCPDFVLNNIICSNVSQKS